MAILLGDLNAKVRRENIFQPTIENENEHPENNNDIRLLNYAISKDLVVRNTTISNRNINYTHIIGLHMPWS